MKEATYCPGGIIEDVKRNDAEKVDGCDKGDWEEELALLDRKILFRNDGKHSIFLDDVDIRLLVLLAGRGGYIGGWSAPASDPQGNCHNSKVDCYKHGTGKIGADADETVRLHKKVEEEALMEMLEQVVKTSKGAFHTSSHCHLILPTFPYRL